MRQALRAPDAIGDLLDDAQAIVDYLHRYPALSVEEMWRIARRLPTPLTITKRGAYAFARKAERPA